MDKAEREKLRSGDCQVLANLLPADRYWGEPITHNMAKEMIAPFLDHIDALERDAERYRVIRAALTSDDCIETQFFNQLNEPPRTPEGFDGQCDSVIAAIASAQEPK